MRDTLVRRYVEALVPLSTLGLALMPLLGPRAMVFVIIGWMGVLAMRSALDPSPVGRGAWQWAGFLAMPFGLMVLDLFRAPDLLQGLHILERGSALLVFPFGFLLLGAPSSDRFREAMMDLFSLAALALAAYGNGLTFFDGLPPRLLGEDFSMVYRAAFAQHTGLHPPYASYFFLTGAIFQLDQVLDRARRPVLRLVAIALLVLAGLLIASRMPLIAFAGGAAAVFLVRMPRRRAWRTALAVFVGVLLLAAITPGARERMAEVLALAQKRTDIRSLNSVDIRVPIAHCSLQRIEENWLLGAGEAHAQALLDSCYTQFGLPMLLNGSYGTHNQLLHWWLCFGLAGVALYIIYFGTLLIRAWQRGDAAHLGFLVLLMLCSTTENILTRQWGVVLFACFNALFVAGTEPDRPRSHS
jgi:O-antigen ligase